MRKLFSILAVSALALQIGCNETTQPSKAGPAPANPMGASKVGDRPSSSGTGTGSSESGPPKTTASKPPAENPEKK